MNDDEDVNEPWHPSVINVNQFAFLLAIRLSATRNYVLAKRGINREFQATIGLRSNEASYS